jgi:hypothetical protein
MNWKGFWRKWSWVSFKKLRNLIYYTLPANPFIIVIHSGQHTKVSNSDIYNIHTRHKYDLHILNANLARYQKEVSYTRMKILNNLSSAIIRLYYYRISTFCTHNLDPIVKKNRFQDTLLNICHENGDSWQYRDYCWQIHLLAELILSATIICFTLSVHCVTIISCKAITILLYREIWMYLM